MRKQNRFITDEQVTLLRYSLRLDNTLKGIKSALQSVCIHYESGRKLQNTSDIRQLIHSHLSSDDILLRRWSMKALGLIADPDDAYRIVDRLKLEDDREAQTWGTAALLGSSTDLSIKEILSRTNLENSTPLMLAARLYAQDRWLRKNHHPITIDLHNDELTLKWAVFLIGYNKAPANLFSENHNNSVFLSELNNHDSQELSEYSVWALYERPEYNFSDLGLAFHNIDTRPDNVRKWLYRLLMQSHDKVSLDSDMISDLSKDKSPSAREGLAQGIVDLKNQRFDSSLLDWYLREKDETVKETLLISVAKKGNISEEFHEIVVNRFKQEAPDSGLRKKLLVASEVSPLYPSLKRMDTIDRLARQGLEEFGFGFDTQSKGGLTLTQNNFHGDVTAQNLVTGNMIGSANGAVQNIQANRSNDKDVLNEVLAFLKNANISDTHKAIVAEKVKAVAETPTSETKLGLFSSIKQIAEATSITGGAIEGLDKIVELVGSFIS